MSVRTPITEAEILERIVASKKGNLKPETARSFLEFQLPGREVARIRRLLRKNNAGSITAAERIARESYIRIGQFLDLLHAKARLSLSRRARAR
jgi:hypothetical protein